MRALLATLALLSLLAMAPFASAGLPETPLGDKDNDGNMELGPVCIWGWPDPCVLQAYECFQPYAPNFAIDCR